MPNNPFALPPGYDRWRRASPDDDEDPPRRGRPEPDGCEDDDDFDDPAADYAYDPIGKDR